MNLRYSPDNFIASQVAPVSLNLEQSYSLVIERARQLVNQLIRNRGHDNPPFLPEEYASLQGIKTIVKEDLGNASGLLLRCSDGLVIKVNQNHNLARQNFSCAHEIGHNLLHELKIELNTEDIEYRTFDPQASGRIVAKARERLCDVVATELLMPESIFKKYLSGFGVSIHSVERLANIFKVSIQTAVIRVAEVSPEPCIALLWRPDTRTKSKALRLARRIGPGRKLINRANYMPAHALVRYPSTLHKAYEYDSSVKCHKLFKIDNAVKRLPMQSKGFGRNETRYVISLAFLNG